jgi:hypothetical protein
MKRRRNIPSTAGLASSRHFIRVANGCRSDTLLFLFDISVTMPPTV